MIPCPPRIHNASVEQVERSLRPLFEFRRNLITSSVNERISADEFRASLPIARVVKR